MSTQFHETVMGRRFIEGTVPKMNTNMESLTRAVEELTIRVQELNEKIDNLNKAEDGERR